MSNNGGADEESDYRVATTLRRGPLFRNNAANASYYPFVCTAGEVVMIDPVRSRSLMNTTSYLSKLPLLEGDTSRRCETRSCCCGSR